MVITWYGQACFKLQSGEKTIVIDPFAKNIGLTPPNLQADIVFVTHDHHDHNNIKSLRGDPFIINGPGEYELGGAKAWGIDSFHDDTEGTGRGSNTLYRIEVEGIRILHLGDLGQSALTGKQLEEIKEIDILMIPVGGTYTIDAKEAVGIVKQVEPKIVIPMHYKIPKLSIKELAGVDKFLKEFGGERIKPQEKLTIKAKDLSQEGEKVSLVVMKI